MAGASLVACVDRHRVGRSFLIGAGEEFAYPVDDVVDVFVCHASVAGQGDESLPFAIGDGEGAVLCDDGIVVEWLVVDAGVDVLVGEVVDQLVADGRVDAGGVELDGVGPDGCLEDVAECFVVALLYVSADRQVGVEFLHLLEGDRGGEVVHVALVSEYVDVVVPAIAGSACRVVADQACVGTTDAEPGQGYEFFVEVGIVGGDHASVAARHCFGCVERPDGGISSTPRTGRVAAMRTVFEDEPVVVGANLVVARVRPHS